MGTFFSAAGAVLGYLLAFASGITAIIFLVLTIVNQDWNLLWAVGGFAMGVPIFGLTAWLLAASVVLRAPSRFF